MEKRIDIKTIVAMSMMELYNWYEKTYVKPVPKATNVVLIGNELGDLLSEYANAFVYFDYLGNIFETLVREQKGKRKVKGTAEKEETEWDIRDLMNKRDALLHFSEEMKFSYNALSRVCTLKIESNKELGMLKG